MDFIECVLNFSEGRDEKSISAIASSVESIEGAYLLGVDSSSGANRCVLTFAGGPEAVLKAAVNVFEKAVSLIDMTTQKGAHPRVGAVDVCPFVPLINSTGNKSEGMNTCIDISRKLAREVSQRFDIPVFLYGEAATDKKRKNLPYIRKGQYEGIEKRIEEENFIPDFWSGKFNKTTGATVIGARDILIAYNVTLDTKNVDIAKRIALGVKEKIPQKGLLRSIGWYIQEYDRCQVSMNILDFRVLSLHSVFELVSETASELGAKVLGSEIVGLAPLKALSSPRISLEQSIDKLALNYHYDFNPDEKVLDFVLALKSGLIDLPQIE